jgi:hypothetical protein
MTRTTRRLAAAALVALAVVALSGCKVTGGGYIPSAFNPTAKATFGFTWQSTDNPDKSTVKGNWADGPVKFKLDSGVVVTITDGQDGCGYGEGTYTSTSKSTFGQQGTIVIEMCDTGEPGPTNGDGLGLALTDGPYSYTNSGSLQGGNLQIKK